MIIVENFNEEKDLIVTKIDNEIILFFGNNILGKSSIDKIFKIHER